MSVLKIGSNDIFVTAHDVLLQMFERINTTTTIPIIHNPGLNYEEVIEHYREQVDERYKDQVGEGSIVVPTLIGWRRQPLRWVDGLGKKNAVQELLCDEYDCNGDRTGNKIRWLAVKCEIPLQFRLYSSDVRIVDAVEVGYLTKTFISDIKEVTVFIADRNSSESYLISWDYLDTELDFTKTDNQYVTYDFSCKVTGNMLVRPEVPPNAAADVAKGIGSDGKYKDVRNLATTYDFSAKFGSHSNYPNSDPKSNGSVYTLINTSDINTDNS